MDRTYSPINSLLEQAAHIVRSKKEATGTLEPTEGYKRRQTEELIKFATANNLWISLADLKVEFLSKGGENEVYTGDKDNIVIKLNNFEYAGDDLENFFIRIVAHNKFFGNVPYQMIGFAYNKQQEFCAVLVQPYILAEREATEDEIATYMQALGFEMDYYDEYHNSDYEVFDAVPNNVLYGIDGNLYFIDTQIRLRS
uniref:putative polyvalent protein kinase domain-containing protein n=1 Tax=Phocaeicola sp. TaxID=2773926 RepID=UPI004029434A